MNLGVSLSDYTESAGFGDGSQSELDQLQKALNAGSLTGRETADQTNLSGAPLKVESLENTLKVLTIKESDIILWKKIPKLPAFNTVEEYNQLIDYGADRGGFNNEGELPEEEDSTFVRRSQLVKFLGTTRSVSHPMQLVNTMIGNVMQNQIQHGTLWILRKVNKALAFANSDIIPQEFNGLYKQHKDAFTSLDAFHNSSSVIDCKGKSLRENDIEAGSLGILENNGEGNLLMAPPRVLSNFVKKFHEFKLIQPNTPQVTAGVMGQKVNSFMSQFGEIELGFDKFLKVSPGKLLSSPSTNSKAPNAPIADVTTPKAAVSDTNAHFAGFTGDYMYAVSAVNRYGESALANLATVGSANAMVTVGATDAVTLKFTSGGGVVSPSGYIIYRSKVNPGTTAAQTTFYPIITISSAELATGYDEAAATQVRDKNRILPDTDQAFLIDPSTDVWSFKQLAPLMKMDLAQVGPANRFMVLLYGTPILYAPKKMVVFINIGEDLN